MHKKSLYEKQFKIELHDSSTSGEKTEQTTEKTAGQTTGQPDIVTKVTASFFFLKSSDCPDQAEPSDVMTTDKAGCTVHLSLGTVNHSAHTL